ncbi:MAG: class I SAM-dependent methyltransferase [Flavobacteriaceae bacterium]|nr:class I SAM-dependent methyltransferase [Flavobacteriaceae bacterium]
MLNSKKYYNIIARDYDLLSRERMNYLNVIDNIIISDNKNKKIKNYLDIGSGDGRRSLKIINSLEPLNSTLVDDSQKMLEQIKSKPNLTVLNNSFFEIETEVKFELMTCLWNVIGHIDTNSQRKQFFQIVDKLLDSNGVFYLDVNNRYNISHYGYSNVMKNLEMDVLYPSESNGEFYIGEGDKKTKVYIHNPFDLGKYVNDLNLEIEKTWFINYKTGEIKETFFEGQLLCKIIKK